MRLVIRLLVTRPRIVALSPRAAFEADHVALIRLAGRAEENDGHEQRGGLDGEHDARDDAEVDEPARLPCLHGFPQRIVPAWKWARR